MNRPTQPHIQKTTRQIILSRIMSPTPSAQSQAAEQLTNCVARSSVRDKTLLSPILSRHLSPAHHPQATASQRLTNCVAQNAIRDRMTISALCV